MNGILSLFLIFGLEFQNEYYQEIQQSSKIQKRIASSFKEKTDFYEANYELCSSIIFPELLRFSSIKKNIEDPIAKALYTIHGSKVSDYSSGLFQMKPSFIEKLEKEIIKYPELGSFFFISEYPDSLSQKEQRSLRFERITDLKWQIEYLICFTKLLDLSLMNHDDVELNTIEGKIKIYSLAYNSGHWYDLEKIKLYQHKKFFPGKLKSFFRKYNYSDIAIYFYKTYFKKEINF